MSCQETERLVAAYIDGELDVANAQELEAHLKNCAGCAVLHEQTRALRDNLRNSLPYFAAPEALREKIHSQMSAPEAPQIGTSGKGSLAWRVYALAASLALIIVSSVLAMQLLRRPSDQILADEVVSSHVRSLLANHMFDVASTDQHTVKPWFNGKLDFAPPVKNLGGQGFPLVGGRLDYLDNRRVAALLYKRAQHPINLFIWPTNEKARRPRTVSIRGYNVVHWTDSGMTYWAVSDANLQELLEFVRDLRE